MRCPTCAQRVRCGVVRACVMNGRGSWVGEGVMRQSAHRPTRPVRYRVNKSVRGSRSDTPHWETHILYTNRCVWVCGRTNPVMCGPVKYRSRNSRVIGHRNIERTRVTRRSSTVSFTAVRALKRAFNIVLAQNIGPVPFYNTVALTW